MCVCECVHTHLCACAKTTRIGSRRNGPFYLFTQLSAGDFAVGVAFPLILRRARFCLSCTKAYPSAWSWNSSAVIQEGPGDRPPRAWVLSGARERRMETGEHPRPMLAP